MVVPVLFSAVRTPFAPFGSALRRVSATALAGLVLAEAMRRGRLLPEDVDHIVLGQAFPAGCGPAPARQAARLAGLPDTLTVHAVSALDLSGLQAVLEAARRVQFEEARLVLACGAESMSQVPFLLPEARWGRRMGASPVLDGLLADGLELPLAGPPLRDAVDRLATDLAIPPADQAAWEAAGLTRAQERDPDLLPVDIRRRSRPHIQRKDVLPETPERACGMSDGAAALAIGSEAAFPALRPCARLLGWAEVAGDAGQIGSLLVEASRQACVRAACTPADLDLIACHEPYAALPLAFARDLPCPKERILEGGSLALGHPLGATGVRLVVDLAHHLEATGLHRGLAVLASAGGQAIALVLERIP